MVPYCTYQSPSKGVFPKNTLSNPCSEYEVDGGVTVRHGVLDISRALIISFMGDIGDGVLHLHFQCKIFPSPLFSINLLWSKTLSVIFKENKRH
jgi:hypothetical protein